MPSMPARVAERGTELETYVRRRDLGTFRGLAGPQLVDEAVDRHGPTGLDRQEPDAAHGGAGRRS